MPTVSRIILYPIKALDGVSVSAARISAAGTLEHDRNFAIFDRDGRYVNGKSNSDVHRLRSEFDLENQMLSIHRQGSEAKHRFQIDRERDALEDWLSNFFGFPVDFRYRQALGFPDDLDAYGPTIISQATLVEIANWYPGLDPSDLRMRLRANIEIEDVPAFWEDQLFDEPNTIVAFRIGTVAFEGTNPCQRCVVPSRDPQSSEAYPDFQRTFAARRKVTLPEWAKVSRFNHFYRVSVNTRIPASENGKQIRIGDELQIIGKRAL